MFLPSFMASFELRTSIFVDQQSAISSQQSEIIVRGRDSSGNPTGDEGAEELKRIARSRWRFWSIQSPIFYPTRAAQICIFGLRPRIF